MEQVLRIGVIGCGEITTKSRGPQIVAAKNAAHVMVMDTREELARDAGQTYGVPFTTSVDELLANPDVDAVYIAVPHFLHAPLTIKALEAGKHVICEKPIATTLADADAMIAKAKDTGCTLSVAYGAQNDPYSVELKDMVAAGAIGKVYGTRIVARSDKPDSYWHGGYTGRVNDDWRTSKRCSGGGVLIMNTIHDLNTMRFITGLEASRVYAEYDTFMTPVEVEDFISVNIRYTNGAIGSLEAGSCIAGRDPLGPLNQIYGEKGHILLSNPPRIFLREPWGDIPAGEWYQMPEDESKKEGAAMFQNFALAIFQGKEPPVSGWDGRQALEIAVAAYKAGVTAQPIGLPL